MIVANIRYLYRLHTKKIRQIAVCHLSNMIQGIILLFILSLSSYQAEICEVGIDTTYDSQQ